ncbi:MAG: hypothetical protein JNM83_03475 [Myxococcales bacterium]|nr:hypothetical protein [Myxococcales bacterium]
MPVALQGTLDDLIATLLALPQAQRDQVCSAIGYRRWPTYTPPFPRDS